MGLKVPDGLSAATGMQRAMPGHLPSQGATRMQFIDPVDGTKSGPNMIVNHGQYQRVAAQAPGGDRAAGGSFGTAGCACHASGAAAAAMPPPPPPPYQDSMTPPGPGGPPNPMGHIPHPFLLGAAPEDAKWVTDTKGMSYWMPASHPLS